MGVDIDQCQKLGGSVPSSLDKALFDQFPIRKGQDHKCTHLPKSPESAGCGSVFEKSVWWMSLNTDALQSLRSVSCTDSAVQKPQPCLLCIPAASVSRWLTALILESECLDLNPSSSVHPFSNFKQVTHPLSTGLGCLLCREINFCSRGVGGVKELIRVTPLSTSECSWQCLGNSKDSITCWLVFTASL